MSTPRVTPGDRRELGLLIWGFTRLAGVVTRTGPPNLFTTLGRHRKLFRGWLRFAGRLMPGGRLPRRESELVILRVAHLRGSDYEREQHERLGRRAGLTDAELRRVGDGPDAEGWSPRDRTLLAAVDELHHTQDLSDATWAELRRLLADDRLLIELVMLAGHYEMLATVIETLRIQPESRR